MAHVRLPELIERLPERELDIARLTDAFDESIRAVPVGGLSATAWARMDLDFTTSAAPEQTKQAGAGAKPDATSASASSSNDRVRLPGTDEPDIVVGSRPTAARRT